MSDFLQKHRELVQIQRIVGIRVVEVEQLANLPKNKSVRNRGEKGLILLVTDALLTSGCAS